MHKFSEYDDLFEIQILRYLRPPAYYLPPDVHFSVGLYFVSTTIIVKKYVSLKETYFVWQIAYSTLTLNATLCT